jgi:hypothetical protein
MFFIISLVFFACSEDEIDTTFPEIKMSFDGAFPKNCDTIYLGETFTFLAIFTDNIALGNFSIEVHNNFDHHTHSTESSVCDYDEDKIAVNPWTFIEQFEIPENLSEFEAEIDFFAPEDIDPGDYHFQIRLTDHEGWQALKGLSIKLLDK